MTFSSDTASDIPNPQEHYIHCARCSAPYLSSDGTAQACDCTPAKTHKEQFLSGCFGSHQHNCARYTVRTPHLLNTTTPIQSEYVFCDACVNVLLDQKAIVDLR